MVDQTVVRVVPSMVAHEALRDHPTSADDVVLMFPVTSREYPGVVFQIPRRDQLSKMRELVIPVHPAMNLERYPPLHAAARTQVA